MIRGKIGDEKILSIWWFIILGILGGSIVAGVFMFYDLEGDPRELHAQIIALRVLDCIEENNFLKNEVVNLEKEGVVKFFKEKCGLRESKDLYVKLSIGGFREEDIVFGNPSIEVDCGLGLDGKTELSKSFSQCYKTERTFIYSDFGPNRDTQGGHENLQAGDPELQNSGPQRKTALVNLVVGVKSLGKRGDGLK